MPTLRAVVLLIAVGPLEGAALLLGLSANGQTVVKPQSMPKLVDIDPRYLSYNVETVEVTGGRFWKPYKDASPSGEPPTRRQANQPVGIDPSLLQYRPPVDLSNPKLRTLASALAPSFMRVSGTWRNSTYFQDDDQPARAAPPDGYRGVMTRAEWKSVIDFSKAVHADLVSSVVTSVGTRGPDGVWIADNTKAWLDYTKSLGGHLAATEFMNEPTYASVGGTPKGYDAQAYAKDIKVFVPFLRKESPDTILLGPGGIGDKAFTPPGTPATTYPGFIRTEQMLQATGPVYDAFSYHFYPGASKRCAGKSAASADGALSAEWLERNLAVEEFYADLRDQFLPGKPMWLTETGEAVCGGDPWAGEFLDSFRFMDQLGSLAQKGVRTVIVNTLASSDYGLLDEGTLDPRPNYWAAVLWKRLMGSRVLDPGPAPSAKVRMYAQCSTQQRGAVTVLLINLDRTSAQKLQIALPGERYTLSSTNLESRSVALNDTQLVLTPQGSLPALSGKPFGKGTLSLAPSTISFFVFPKASNGACK